MNQKINLSEILKGHKGEAFYNPLLGCIKLVSIENGLLPFIYGSSVFGLPYDGTDSDGNLVVFPSKNQRDWNKWLEEQGPKIWDDIKECDVEILNAIRALESNGPINHIVKSALALLKINRLIEAGYGGNITNEEWAPVHVYHYTINYNKYKRKFDIYESQNNKYHVAFHTKNQAEEFLSRPENVELLKDYFMI